MSDTVLINPLLGLKPFVLVELGQDDDGTLRSSIQFGGGITQDDLGDFFTLFRAQFAEPIKVTDELVDLFGEVWAKTPEGEPGARRRAALQAVIDLVQKEYL